MKETGSKVRVIYADTDAMGIVYYENYLKWFEMARADHLWRIGITNSELEQPGWFLPVSEACCHYLAPARYDNLLAIEAETASRGRASIRFKYAIRGERGKRRLAEGYTLHAFTDKESEIRRIPEDIVKKMDKGEGEIKW